MNQYEAAMYQLKGIISEANPEEQAKVNDAAAKIRSIVEAGGDEAKVALSLVVAEVMSKS